MDGASGRSATADGRSFQKTTSIESRLRTGGKMTNSTRTMKIEPDVAVGFSTAKSEALLRAAILAFADEIADAPDDFEESPGEGAKDYEAKVRQAANSPYIDQQSLLGFLDNELHRMKKMNTVASPRKK
jgi:hypothetical protein